MNMQMDEKKEIQAVIEKVSTTVLDTRANLAFVKSASLFKADDENTMVLNSKIGAAVTTSNLKKER